MSLYTLYIRNIHFLCILLGVTVRKVKTYTRRPTSSGWAKKNTYRGIEYRSLWETYVAKLLLYAGLDFQYEPRRFYLTDKLSYLPDFYIPELAAYIEVKGWLKEKDKVRISLFKTRVTGRLIYMGEHELEEVFGDSAAKISKLDFEKYVPSKQEILRFHKLIQKSLRG